MNAMLLFHSQNEVVIEKKTIQCSFKKKIKVFLLESRILSIFHHQKCGDGLILLSLIHNDGQSSIIHTPKSASFHPATPYFPETITFFYAPLFCVFSRRRRRG
jgi:hypothetical protein